MRMYVKWFLCLLVCMAPCNAVFGQNNNGGNTNNSNNQNNNNNNGGGGGVQAAGVVISPEGVLRVKQFGVNNPGLVKKWRSEVKSRLPGDLAKGSELRKVSLNRLEAAVAASLEKGQPLPDEVKYLAGLTRLQYVFFYPDTKDVVIAGPAEAYALDASGRCIGVDSGRAVLELQDLVVALRAFKAGGDPTAQIGCSIDPTSEGLANMQQYLVSISGRVSPNDAGTIVENLKVRLGLQKVTVQGISPDTHFAQVLVEADYRMKLIGIGIETPPVKIASYVSKASPASVSRNALQRWFFEPNYDCVSMSDDGLAMELVGEGVKLIGEGERVQADGTRANVGNTGSRASELFCHGFTSNYPSLAKKVPVYAQLRNLMDMAIAAAHIQEQDFATKAEWNMEVFGNEEKFAVEVYETPKTVETACTAVFKGSTLMTPVGGGVVMFPTKALEKHNVKVDAKVSEVRTSVTLEKLEKSQWWWD